MKGKKFFLGSDVGCMYNFVLFEEEGKTPEKVGSKKRKAKTTFLFPFFFSFWGYTDHLSFGGEMEVFRSGGEGEEEEEVEERRELAI